MIYHVLSNFAFNFVLCMNFSFLFQHIKLLKVNLCLCLVLLSLLSYIVNMCLIYYTPQISIYMLHIALENFLL